MKLILEGCSLLTGHIEDELNEGSGSTERNYYLTGICSTPEVKNRNGRFYSRAIWEREVAAYQSEIETKSVNSLGEWQHPARSTVDPMKSVMRITELAFKEDGNVWVKAKILNDNTEQTNKLKGLIKEGIKIGISTRGVGKVSSTGVVEDFKLITADLVDMPSDYNAMLNGVVEGVQFLNGVAQDKEYKIDENGCIGEVCGLTLDVSEANIEANTDSKEKCPIQEKIEEAVLAAKTELVEHFDKIIASHSEEIKALVESNEAALVENLDLFFKENGLGISEEASAEIKSEVEKTKLNDESAKALIEVLKLMSENKFDSELEALVHIKKISTQELKKALDYSLTLADNDVDIAEWEKDMKETFPTMDNAVFTRLKNKFLGK